ncbi:unnamed protein product [Notodromas monacha]|uniref:Uncharacterized protein n=1 Tax=Notodromas monacha TaxID=399045 RepID=A0A7R9BZS4_9CRUS|nr:unnamed protein product [Notodromas monacha]CAG0923512.1 unnamed protein product [Notodromas monacha]
MPFIDEVYESNSKAKFARHEEEIRVAMQSLRFLDVFIKPNYAIVVVGQYSGLVGVGFLLLVLPNERTRTCVRQTECAQQMQSSQGAQSSSPFIDIADARPNYSAQNLYVQPPTRGQHGHSASLLSNASPTGLDDETQGKSNLVPRGGLRYDQGPPPPGGGMPPQMQDEVPPPRPPLPSLGSPWLRRRS